MSLLGFDTYLMQINTIINEPLLPETLVNNAIRLIVHESPISLHQLDLQKIIRTSPLGYNDVCRHVNRCSYNPNVSGVPLQRCNLKGQQVLYATVPCQTETFKEDAMLPSILETCFQKIKDDPTFDNKLIVVSEWVPQRALLAWSLPFHTTSINKNKIFKQLYDETVSNIEALSETPSDKEKFLQQLSYLSGLYCKQEAKENVYKFTAMFYNRVIQHVRDERGVNLDGLIYPAAYTDGEAMSIVLNKQVVDSKAIVCKYARLQLIRRHANDKKNIIIDILAEALPDEYGNLDFKRIKV